MAILTVGIWFLIVILIGIPPVMIRDAEHPVLGGGMGFVGVFLPFMGVRKIDLCQLASWKSFVFGIILQYPTQDISWGQPSRTVPQPLWIRGANKY